MYAQQQRAHREDPGGHQMAAVKLHSHAESANAQLLSLCCRFRLRSPDTHRGIDAEWF